MFIVLSNGSVAKYPLGGGHWSWFLQYPLGLKALGHKILWMELMQATTDETHDLALIRNFFARIRNYELADDCVLLLLPRLDMQEVETARFFGKTGQEVVEAIRSSDLLWNFCCAMRDPLLAMFKRRVLIDVDPGHLQVAALSYNLDMGISSHDAYLTVGSKILDPDCGVPTLGHTWKPFFPFVYLPLWQAASDPGVRAPFTSITQWEWDELAFNDRVLSISKRSAYRKYAALPYLSGRSFELAANIGLHDIANDREFLIGNGWDLVEPNEVIGTPLKYKSYIQQSRAEIQCPKPIFRDLNTGWLSDRSISYLASARPVLAENTGFVDKVPAGMGLVAFASLDEAIAGVSEIDKNYQTHSRAAREMATQLFSSTCCLPAMIADSS